jgi:hypothetical protein
LLLVLVLSPAFADAPGWVLYTHPDKLMSVRFPGKPTEANQEREGPAGQQQLKVATFIDGDRAFVVTAGAYPAGTKLDVKSSLDKALDGVLASIRGHVVAQRPITLDGFQGRDIQFEAPGPYNNQLHGVARVFVSVTPPGSYVALAMQMDGKPDPTAVKFLDSIHLGSKVEPHP